MACLSELAGLYPLRGLLASICTYSHNKDFAFLLAIANWFGTLCVVPSEAIATSRYLDWPTESAIPLILIYAVLNHWGVRFFTAFNTPFMFLKISVPILTIGALLWHGVHAEHFSLEAMEDTGPILSTFIAGGVIYGFNGCQMIVKFTAEAKAPHKSIPLSMFLALLIALLVYLAL